MKKLLIGLTLLASISSFASSNCTTEIKMYNYFDYDISSMEEILNEKNIKIAFGEAQGEYSVDLHKEIVKSDAGSWFSPIFPSCQYETYKVVAQLKLGDEVISVAKSQEVERAIICHDRNEPKEGKSLEMAAINAALNDLSECESK